MNLLNKLIGDDLRKLSWICYGIGYGALVPIVFGVHYFLVAPLKTRAQDIDRETRSVNAMVQLMPKIIEESASLKRRTEEVRGKVDELHSRLPTTAEEAEFLLQLTELSKRYGLEMSDYRPSTMTNDKGPSELLVTITLDGRYEGICRFLHEIDAIPRLIRTSKFHLRPSDSDRFVAELQLAAYYRGAGSTSSPAADPKKPSADQKKP